MSENSHIIHTDDPYGDFFSESWNVEIKFTDDPYGDLIPDTWEAETKETQSSYEDDEDSPFDDLTIDEDYPEDSVTSMRKTGESCQTCRYGSTINATITGKVWCLEDDKEKCGNREPDHWCKKYSTERKGFK